jgi:hypothetical protein
MHLQAVPKQPPPARTGARILVSLQAYAYPDNTDGGQVMSNTAIIAYPQSEGYSTLHEQATEGAGTFDDPITFATYELLTEGDQAVFAPETRIYVEALRKYWAQEHTTIPSHLRHTLVIPLDKTRRFPLEPESTFRSCTSIPSWKISVPGTMM